MSPQGMRTMAMDLETRVCPTCKKPFRVLKGSKQKYDTTACVEFKSGKLKQMSRQELLDFKRGGCRRGIDSQE